VLPALVVVVVVGAAAAADDDVAAAAAPAAGVDEASGVGFAANTASNQTRVRAKKEKNSNGTPLPRGSMFAGTCALVALRQSNRHEAPNGTERI
jgi:hypothetical protein